MTEPAPAAPTPAAPLTEAEDKQWASFAHFGGIKVNAGESYRYPFAIRFIK